MREVGRTTRGGGVEQSITYGEKRTVFRPGERDKKKTEKITTSHRGKVENMTDEQEAEARGVESAVFPDVEPEKEFVMQY